MARPDGHGGRVIKLKKKYPGECRCADMKAESVQCDGKCQEWFLFCCLGITVKPPKDEKWYCGACNPAGSIPNWKEDLERHKKRIKGSDGKPVPNMNKTEQLPIVIMPADERAKLKTCRRPCGTPSCNQKDSHDGACDPELALAGNPGSRRSRSGRASSSPTPDATRRDAAATLLMMALAAGKPAHGNGNKTSRAPTTGARQSCGRCRQKKGVCHRVGAPGHLQQADIRTIESAAPSAPKETASRGRTYGQHRRKPVRLTSETDPAVTQVIPSVVGALFDSIRTSCFEMGARAQNAGFEMIVLASPVGLV